MVTGDASHEATFSSVMPSLDNANPIIFKPTQQSVRASEKDKVSLWEDEVVGREDLGDGRGDELEDADPIDEQEVFGAELSVYDGYT
jgi:hypothetical protein